MAVPTLETVNGSILVIIGGTSGDPVTWDDVWAFGAGGGAGLVTIDEGGTARVDTFMTKIVDNEMYTIQKDIEFGNDSDASYFTIIGGAIRFQGEIEVKANATLQVGEWEEIGSAFLIADNSKNGSFISFTKVHGSTANYYIAGTLLIYGSTLRAAKDGATHRIRLFFLPGGRLEYKQSQFSGFSALRFADSSTELVDVVLNDSSAGFFTSASSDNDWRNVSSARFTLNTALITIKGVNVGDTLLIQTGAGGIMIDPVSLGNVTNTTEASFGIRKQTCNIHVTDKDGGDLQDVTVDCEFANLVKGDDNKCYKCVRDHTSVDDGDDGKPTGNDANNNWELYDDDGNLGGDHIFGFDYKAGEEEFAQQTTGVDGDIDPQVIQYKKWTGTGTDLEARIHKITFTHDDYPDDIIENVIVDHPLVWRIDMGQNTADIIAATETAINNQIALTGGKIDGVALVDLTTENTDMVGTDGANTGDVTLANGPHGGVDAVLSLKKVVIDNDTALEAAVYVNSIGVGVQVIGVLGGITANGNGASAYGLALTGGLGGIFAAEIDAIIAAIGTPANIDGGGASLAANLKKFADDNGGLSFDASLHSLLKMLERGNVAWNTGVGTVASKSYTIDSTEIIEGDVDAGDDTKINIVDGDYWSIGETNANTYLEVNFSFIAASGSENPVSVEMWLQYDGGGNHHMDVKAYNYADSGYEIIGEIPKTGEIVHFPFTLHPKHINSSTGAIIIKLVHNGNGVITHVLHIDKIIVMTATASIVESNIAAILNDTGTSGVKVASDGLDTINITPAADIATSNFREMIVAIWRRFFKKVTASKTKLKTYADNGSTVISEQDVTEGDTDIVDEATTP